jgi:hypothetical protein
MRILGTSKYTNTDTLVVYRLYSRDSIILYNSCRIRGGGYIRFVWPSSETTPNRKESYDDGDKNEDATSADCYFLLLFSCMDCCKKIYSCYLFVSSPEMIRRNLDLRTWRGRISMVLSLCLIVTLEAKKNVESIPATQTSKNGDDLRDWIRARCSDKGVAIWVYEGALFDPLQGRRIASVEGLELVHCLTDVGESTDPDNKKRFSQKCGDLEVGPLVAHENATFDRASVIMSRKLFCYRSPDNPRQLLNSIRLRPNAPLRKIPTKQAVAVYDTATTFIARGQELIAHTEWPDRQSIWGIATRNILKNNDDSNSKPADTSTKSFDFTIYARQKSAKKKQEQLFDLTKPPRDPGSKDTAAVASPQRAKLIEFGTSSSGGKDKFGARESYAYTIQPMVARSSPSSGNIFQKLGLQQKQQEQPPETPISCQVRYSRYGEGPPFFGPGRICSLELQGRRVQSLDDIPPLTKSLIAERMSPQLFLAPVIGGDSETTTTNDDGNGSKIRWFRAQGPALHVRPADDEVPDFWLPDYLRERGSLCWNKIQRACFGNRRRKSSSQ